MTIDPNISALLETYHKEVISFDEMCTSEMKIRPQWLNLLGHIGNLGKEGMATRLNEINRLLKENGVTYNIYGNPGGDTTPWKLDPIPYIITQEDWSLLELGLKQRAALLSLIFKDLYGEKRLIKEGILPAELIFSDPNYLRPCDQVVLPQKNQILFYGVDISRGPDGRHWVVQDKTQAPSGWAYTLENRMVMARVLPELFRQNKISKILSFYNQARDILNQSVNLSSEARIVILTPGPRNETYFEHAYMASMLGFSLVQGQDLMVKDDCVWLKTLGGLEKVDIIIRRIDDVYCDPLSLKADSQLGVAGLLEVARRGNVLIANPLGSSILENIGLMAFMPNICKYFLGEDLVLNNIATWWCGQDKERSYVLENIDKLVIKNISTSGLQSLILGWKLSKEERGKLINKINRFPFYFVAQDQVLFSSSPIFSDDRLLPRKTVLRCFSMATPDQYSVMPGGLTRSAPKFGNNYVSGQTGSISKDTWVLSSKREATPLGFDKVVYQAEFKGLDELPSRTAENLYWVGRYTVRMLYTARLLRRVLRYKVELESFEEPADQMIFEALAMALTHLTLTYPGFVGEEGAKNLENPESELRSICLDDNRVGSLAYAIKMWKSAANAIRDRWSMDIWRIFDQVEETWRQMCESKDVPIRQIRDALDQLIIGIAASWGLTQNSLSSEDGKPMYDIGRTIEKGLMISNLFRATVVIKRDSIIEGAILEAILKSNESLFYLQK